MKTLTEQLEKQHQIEQQLEPIESKISEFLNQKEIFDKLKESIKYQFEVKDVVTNKYCVNLIPKDKNTYNLFIGIQEDYDASAYKSFVSSYIKLNNRKDKLKFKIGKLKNNIFTTEDIINVIQMLVGK